MMVLPVTTSPRRLSFLSLAVVVVLLLHVVTGDGASTHDDDDASCTASSGAAAMVDGECNNQPSSDDDGANQVINAILANMWPAMGNSILANIRANPVLADPYLLKVTRGKFRYAPTIRDMQLLSPLSPGPSSSLSDDAGLAGSSNNSSRLAPPPPPPRFQCAIVYQGRPGIDLVLTGADLYNKTATEKVVVGVFKRLMRRLVPDIFVRIVSVDLLARIEVELDMSGTPSIQNKQPHSLEFFFLGRPVVQWDLEFTLTKAHIPLLGEDSLDSILTHALEGIDQDHPVRIKF